MKADIKRIVSKLKELGFGEHWEQFLTLVSLTTDTHEQSAIILKEKKDDGDFIFNMSIINEAVGLSFPFFTARYNKPIPVEHALINGEDTKQLEQLLSSIDWYIDFVKLEERAEKAGKGITQEIQRYHSALARIVTLAATDEGKAISDALKIKYLLGTPYEARYVFDDVKLKFVTERTFLVDDKYGFTKTEAANLLMGRAVLKPYLDEGGNKKKEWFVAASNPENTVAKEYLFTGGQTIYPNYDLASVLTTLPMIFSSKEQKAAVLQSLQCGELHKAAIVKKGKEEVYFIEANPEAKSINIYNESVKPVTRKEMLLDFKAAKPNNKGMHL